MIEEFANQWVVRTLRAAHPCVGTEEMKRKTAIRDGIIIAAVLMICRFLLGWISGWPEYSWPEIGCLYVASEIIGLGEGMWVHVMAPMVSAIAVGAVTATVLSSLPKVREMTAVRFRWALGVSEGIVLLLPIALFPTGGWI